MRNNTLAVITIAILLTGCKTATVAPTSGEGQPATTGGATTAPVETTAGGSGQGLSAEQLARQELERAGMVVYFDYDSAEIKPEYNAVVTAHARYLSGEVGRKVRLEGSTDERGSREYNIGLGERRAQTVRRALLLQGVSEAQISTLSYGEERPAVAGSDEAAYARNRRVEFGY